MVKGYEFLSFAKNMGKEICKDVNKNLSVKYSPKLLDHAKKPATDALKTSSKRVIQKTAKATGDLIAKKLLKQLQMSMIKKYLKKVMYLNKKDK